MPEELLCQEPRFPGVLRKRDPILPQKPVRERDHSIQRERGVPYMPPLALLPYLRIVNR